MTKWTPARISVLFGYKHLPETLREVSENFHDMATWVWSNLPDDDERNKCLDRLLEAKDCAVRAKVLSIQLQ